MRSDYIGTDALRAVLWGLTPANRLVCEIALQTGWRVDDVLGLTTEQLRKASQNRTAWVTITESKTGKKSRKALPRELVAECLDQAGKLFVFQNRDDWRKHRTRQAVFMDLKKVAKFYKIKTNLSPHSLRKNYAVDLYRKNRGDLGGVAKALNHDSELVTLIYALSDEITEKKRA